MYDHYRRQGGGLGCRWIGVMKVLLDTSTPLCRIWIYRNGNVATYEWQADRTLARDLLSYLRNCLKEHEATFADITGIGVYRGPGSFTGLRIGMTVLNTLADSLQVPIVGSTGDNWRALTLERLENEESDTVVTPEYGREARITTPRK